MSLGSVDPCHQVNAILTGKTRGMKQAEVVNRTGARSEYVALVGAQEEFPGYSPFRYSVENELVPGDDCADIAWPGKPMRTFPEMCV